MSILQSNFYATESESSLLRVDRLTEERQSTAKLTTALAASQAECEDLRFEPPMGRYAGALLIEPPECQLMCAFTDVILPH